MIGSDVFFIEVDLSISEKSTENVKVASSEKAGPLNTIVEE